MKEKYKMAIFRNSARALFCVFSTILLISCENSDESSDISREPKSKITKDKPGGMTVGDKSLDVIEDRSTFYLKRNQADETTKGRKPPDEYDEVKEIPGPDGTFDDVDDIDNETVKEILEELGETRTKKASGGLAYMLGE